jgi:hypothetical protein
MREEPEWMILSYNEKVEGEREIRGLDKKGCGFDVKVHG